MEVKSCRVTISDMGGVAHTVEVTAATLYEAVALGLKHLQGNEWVENIAGGLNEVCVSVKSVHVEHRVRMAEFKKWLGRWKSGRHDTKTESARDPGSAESYSGFKTVKCGLRGRNPTKIL
jgi:hypothetical protein